MREFDVYSPVDVITANLEELRERRLFLDEQERAHLHELAIEIFAVAKLPELLAALPDHRLGREESHLPSHAAEPERTRRTVVLCREIARLSRERKELPIGFFLPESELLPVADAQRIIYQRNSYTNEAFLQFSAKLSGARAAYAHSYLAACEDVYNGVCEYCILPIENSSEGRLTSFLRLIEQFDLKITATCDILGNGSARSTRFALLRRNLLPVVTAKPLDQYLALSLPAEHTPTSADLLYAAALLGLPCRRTDSIPRQGAEHLTDTHFVFQTTEGDLRAFLLYLAMEAPHATLLGLYSHFTQKGMI